MEKFSDSAVACSIAYRIRWLLYLVALGTLSGGIAGPSVQFIMTSFFAQGFNGGDCDQHPTSKPCRQGASELAVYNGVSNGLSHAVAWAVAMLLGSWSDTMGRRPIICAKSIFATLPALALCLHVFRGWTLWFYLVLTPVNFTFDNIAVFLASINDVITEPHLRSASFGVLLGFFIVMAGLTLPLGGLLPQHAAVAVSFALMLVQVAYAFMCFPETLPKSIERQTPQGLCAIIRKSIEVFGRNDFIYKMVFVLVLSGFSTSGLSTLLPSYAMAYLGFNRKMGTVLAFFCGTSIGISLTFVLPPLLHRFGDVVTMKICLVLAVVYPLLIPVCSGAVQFMVLTTILIGPCAMVFPVISSIKSNLVGEDEQGIVQGALAAVRVLAVAVSDPLCGFLFRFSTDNGARESRFAALPTILLVAALAMLACLVARDLPSQPPPPKGSSREDVEMSCAGLSAE